MQTRVFLFGFGYMGRQISRALGELETPVDLRIIDPCMPQSGCLTSIEAALDGTRMNIDDVAIVATPALTHFRVLSQLVAIGCRNIFTEKPGMLTLGQLDAFEQAAAPKGVKTAVGYLLRFSAAVCAYLSIRDTLSSSGFKFTGAKIVYGKDKSFDKRSEHDIGLYEELPHIFDLLGYLNHLPSASSVNDIELRKVYDPNRQGRVISAEVFLAAKSSGEPLVFEIVASFRQTRRVRCFEFLWEKGRKRRIVRIQFDTDQEVDVVTVLGDEGSRVLVAGSFRAKLKLQEELGCAIRWFTGKQSMQRLHRINQSRRILEFLSLLDPHQSERFAGSNEHICVAEGARV